MIGEIRRGLQCYLGVLAVFWPGLLLRQGLSRASNDTLVGWRVNDLPPNERLRRYYDRRIDWPESDRLAGLAVLGGARFF